MFADGRQGRDCKHSASDMEKGFATGAGVLWRKPGLPEDERLGKGRINCTFQMLQPMLLFVTLRGFGKKIVVFKKGLENISKVRRQGAACRGVKGFYFICVSAVY